jgi:hypothetical protein
MPSAVSGIDVEAALSVGSFDEEETMPVETAVDSLAGESGVQAPPSITTHTIHRERNLRFFISATFIPG